jgi:hypothetical protein
MRHWLQRILLAAFVTAFGIQPTLAQAPGAPFSFSSVSVDVSHLRAIGVGPYADIVQAAMSDELRRAFADRLGGRGSPRLVVRVTGLFLTSLPESGGRPFSGSGRGTSTDSVDGEALVVGPRGEILARYPQHNALVPHGSAWYDPLNEQKRADAVARNYAQWLRRHTVP